jgi:putative FmdB family regulatory protein
MPIYEYDCPDCSGRFDEIVKLRDPNPPCPRCEGTQTKRRLSIPAAIFGNGIRPDAPPRPGSPMDRYRNVDLNTVPYVTQDGSIASHTGQILVKPNGDPAV